MPLCCVSRCCSLRAEVQVLGAAQMSSQEIPLPRTQSHTEQNMKEKFSQLSFKDSKPYTSNGRVNYFRTGPAGQKHEMRGSNQKNSCNVDLESEGLSRLLSLPVLKKSASFRGELQTTREAQLFPKMTQQQAEPSLPNNMKAACEKTSGCCGSPQPKPHHSQLLHRCHCPSSYLQMPMQGWQGPPIIPICWDFHEVILMSQLASIFGLKAIL